MNNVNDDEFKEILRIKKVGKQREHFIQKKIRTKPWESSLPKNFIKMLSENKIYDYPPDERVHEVLKYLEERKMRSSTAKKYFNILKAANIFGDTTLKINTIFYDQIKAPQQRVPKINEFEKLIELCNKWIRQSYDNKLIINTSINSHDDENLKILTKINKAFAIKFAYLSVLRLAEVCSITNQHLAELLEHKTTLLIHRKTTEEWTVVYYAQFNELLQYMKYFYKQHLDLLSIGGVMNVLFQINRRTLQYAINEFYEEANNGKKPPIGFGLHTLRYIIGTKIVASGDIETARIMLNHKSTSTTKIYTRYDAIHTEKILKEISEKDEYYKNLNNIFKK